MPWQPDPSDPRIVGGKGTNPWFPRMFQRTDQSIGHSQLDVFNCQGGANLSCGPRLSGKTLINIHRVVRHLWETPGASFAMFSKTMKKASKGGTWNDMHKIILPEWTSAGIGLRYTTLDSEKEPGWKTDGTDRTPYFRITNCHGGESECFLFSLDYDADIENRVKEQRFSGIYFSELSSFTDPRVLLVSILQLRMPHLSLDEHIWLADTNPGEDGEGSWIYKHWYILPRLSYEDYKIMQEKDGQEILEEEIFNLLRTTLRLYQLYPEDNPFLEPAALARLKMACASDRGLFARHVKGEWVYGDGDKSKHFNGFFFPHIHTIGSIDSPNEEEHTVLLPSDGCLELITGWDLGDVNHSAHLIEPKLYYNELMFLVLAELVTLKEEVSIEDFTNAFMELVTDIELRMGRQYTIARSWSDMSAMERYSATANAYTYQLVARASGDRIQLQGVKKGPGSVRLRVRETKKLLKARPTPRLLVSADCPMTIKMLKELKKGRSVANYVVPDGNQHAFDSLSYCVVGEMGEELELERPNTGRRLIVQA